MQGTTAGSEKATRRDAGELMDAWQVESSSGARDGLVAFVNPSPSDPKHGAAALFAGSAHVKDGSLSAARWGISGGSGASGYAGYTGTSWTDSGASGSSAGGSGSSGGGGGGDSSSGGSSGGGSF